MEFRKSCVESGGEIPSHDSDGTECAGVVVACWGKDWEGQIELIHDPFKSEGLLFTYSRFENQTSKSHGRTSNQTLELQNSDGGWNRRSDLLDRHGLKRL